MCLVVISTIEDAVNNLLVFAVGLATSDQHLSMLVFNNMTSIKRVNSFKHIAIRWLECRCFLYSTSPSMRRQSRFNS